MPLQAPRTTRLARRASRRVFGSRAIRSVGRALVIASLAGIAPALGASVRFGTGVGIGILGGCLVLGALTGIALAAARRARLVAAAACVDEALALRDRLSSALELAEDSDEDQIFAQWAVRDAEQVAASVRVAQAVPIRGTRDWLLWPVLSTAAVAGILLLPPYLQQQSEPSREELTQTRESIVRAAQIVEEQAAADGTMPVADRAMLERLSDIERELAEGRRTPQDARTASAAVLEERARELAEEAEREQAELQQKIRQISTDPDSPISDLADALRRGDFAQASERLRELGDQTPALDDETRRRIVEDLRQIARQLAPEAEPAPQPQTPESEPPPSPDRQPPPQPSRQDEPSQPADVPVPDDEPSADHRPKQPTQELSDRLSELADQIEQDPEPLQPEPPNRPQENPESQQQQRLDRDRPAEQDRQPRPAEGKPRPEPEKGSQKPGEPKEQPEPGIQPQPTKQERSPDEQKPPAPAEGDTPAETQKPGQGQPSGPEQQPAGERPPQTEQRNEPTEAPQQVPSDGQFPEQDRPEPIPQRPQTQPGQENATPSTQRPPGERRPGATNGQQPDPLALPTPEAVAQPGSTSEQQDQTQPPAGRGDRLQDVIEQLEKMDRQQLESLRKMAQSRRMLDAAQELLERASPEELERLRELGRRLGADRPPEESAQEPWNPETELFDASGGRDTPADDVSRVIGETEPTGDVPGEPLARTTTQDLAVRLREAAAGVERAIEGQAIPARARDYVRRVYRRYESGATGTTAREGRDADAPSGKDE